MLLLLGYTLMALTYSGALSNSSYILMAVYFCMAGIGSAGVRPRSSIIDY